jgi:hypothetical protein
VRRYVGLHAEPAVIGRIKQQTPIKFGRVDVEGRLTIVRCQLFDGTRRRQCATPEDRPSPVRKNQRFSTPPSDGSVRCLVAKLLNKGSH